MAYQALYRKYRPNTFDEVVGQEHITKTIKNQILSEKIGHAYLFCGIRGTGKTSIAKIFAKSVNCPNNKDGNPCLVCDVCTDIAKDASIDVIEIDAASNNGVDNVREIKEEVKYMPTSGKYKVYIIDEVHMLSTSAFNALLKTLEEPPAHVIFILATTESQKIPATILSRCQRFELRRIPVKEIAKVLSIYMQKEDIKIEDRALQYIASRSDGSMRDSLSVLDQIAAFSLGKEITYDSVLEILGVAESTTCMELINYLYENDLNKCLENVNDLYAGGGDIKQFVSQMIEFLRNLLVVCSIHNPEDILDMSKEAVDKLKQLAQKVGYNKVLEYITEFSNLDARIKYDAHPKITLEVMLVRLCSSFINKTSHIDIEREVNKENIKKEQELATKHERIKQKASKVAAIYTEVPTSELSISEEMKKGIKVWKDIKEACKEPLKCMLVDTEAKYYNEKNYCIVCPNEMIKTYAEKNVNVIKAELSGIIKKEIGIKILTKEEYEKDVLVACDKVEQKKDGADDGLGHVEDFFGKFGVKVQSVE